MAPIEQPLPILRSPGRGLARTYTYKEDLIVD